MATGIRTEASTNSVIDAMLALEEDANWNGKTAAQRSGAIAAVAVAQLRSFGVYPPRLDVKNLDGLGLHGQFDMTLWTLEINESLGRELVAPAGVDEDDEDLRLIMRRMVIAQLADTILHEARHCEQWFRMARLVVDRMRDKGLLVSARVVASKMVVGDIPPKVSETAIEAAISFAERNPLSGTEKTEAEMWFNSVYGSGGSSRELRLGSTFSSLKRAETKVGGVVSSNISSGVQRQTSAAYQRGLAEEEDAHALGLQIQTKYLRRYGLAPRPLVTKHAPVAAGVQLY